MANIVVVIAIFLWLCCKILQGRGHCEFLRCGCVVKYREGCGRIVVL